MSHEVLQRLTRCVSYIGHTFSALTFGDVSAENRLRLLIALFLYLPPLSGFDVVRLPLIALREFRNLVY